MTKDRMTICLTDVERFNFATRNMSLEETAEFVQGLYERIGDVLLAHNGRLIKYMGDGALMAFGPGREEIAVRAMWTLRETYREYAEAAGPDIRVSGLNVGIATGDIIAGQMGHPQMLGYDVLGKPVTVTFSLVRCGGVAVDQQTYEAIRGRVVVEPVSPAADISGYRVVGFR
jgi:adenylate cyclase